MLWTIQTLAPCDRIPGELIDNRTWIHLPIGRTARTTLGPPRTERSIFRTLRDGVFESLDDRKKENLLTVIRAYAELGIQSIVTLIDSDLPPRTEREGPVFTPEEIIVTLHDETEQGRIFRMKSW